MTEFYVFQKIKLWAFEYAKNPCKNEIDYIKRTIYSYKQNNPIVNTSYEYENINKMFDNIDSKNMDKWLDNIHDYIVDTYSRRLLNTVFC